MTDANRILEAAKATPIAHRLDAEDDVRPVVVAVLRELAKGYDEYTEGVIGDELSELADEIDRKTR